MFSLIRTLKTVVSYGFLFIFITYLFFEIPDMALTRMLSIPAIQQKLVTLQHASYWQYRAMMQADPAQPAPEQTLYGTLHGLTQKGRVALTLVSDEADGSTSTSGIYPLAGLTLTDVYGAAKEVGAFRDASIKADLYPAPNGKAVVIWLYETPLNLRLIEHGLAVPDAQPETSILNQSYAAYYWSKYDAQ